MLENVLRKVRALDNAFRQKGSTTWYRGHRRSKWRLTSTLDRYVERLIEAHEESFTEQKKRDLLRAEYKTLYRRFKADAWSLLEPAERSDWGVIFKMQHYRFPTRLLDWTESFGCALFFAQQCRQLDEAATVWVLDSEGLNEVSLGKRSLVALDETVGESTADARGWHPRWEPPSMDLFTIAVSPILTNPRMTAQRSAFTLTGDSFLPLDEQFGGRLVRDNLLVKIELPAESFTEVDEYLHVMGIGAFTYFPDFQGLVLDHEARTEARLRDSRKFFSGQVKKNDRGA